MVFVAALKFVVAALQFVAVLNLYGHGEISYKSHVVEVVPHVAVDLVLSHWAPRERGWEIEREREDRDREKRERERERERERKREREREREGERERERENCYKLECCHNKLECCYKYHRVLLVLLLLLLLLQLVLQLVQLQQLLIDKRRQSDNSITSILDVLF